MGPRHLGMRVDASSAPTLDLVHGVARITSRARDTRAVLRDVCDFIAARAPNSACAAWKKLDAQRPAVTACAGEEPQLGMLDGLVKLRAAQPPQLPGTGALVEPQHHAALQRPLVVIPLEWDGVMHGELWVTLEAGTQAGDPRWAEVREVALLLSCALERLHGATRLRETEQANDFLRQHLMSGVAHCRLVDGPEGWPADWEYVQVNPAFSRITGLQDVVGRRVSQIIPTLLQDNPEVLRIHAAVVRTGEPARYETYLKSFNLWLGVTAYRTTPGHFAAVFEDLGPAHAAAHVREKERQQLEALLEQLPAGVCLFDRDMCFVTVNARFCQQAGCTAAALVGRNVYDVFPQMAAQWREVHRRCLQGEALSGDRERVLDLEGREVWMRWEVRPWRNAAGEVQGAISYTEDVTARVTAEREAREAHQRLTAVMDSMDDLLFGLDLEGRFLDFHAPDRSALRVSPEPFIGKRFCEMLPPHVGDQMAAVLEAVRCTGKPQLADYAMTPGNNAVWWSAKVSARKDPDGTVVGYTVVSRNITDRKLAEARLQESEMQMRALLDVAPVGIAQAAPEGGRLLLVNTELCRILGYSHQELLELSVPELTHPEDRPGDQPLFAAMLAGRSTLYQREKRFRCRDGGYRWVNVNAVLLRDDAGRPLRTVATIEDITQRREKESQARLLTTALHAAGLGIAVTDPDANIQWVNPALSRMSGYEPQELLGKNMRVLASGSMPREMYKQLWQTIKSGQVWSGEVVNRHKNGALYPEDMTITPVMDAQGTITNYIAVKRDASLRKETLAALHNTEEHYAALVNNVDEVIYTADLDGRITLVNAAVSRFGFTPGQVIGTLARDYIHPGDLARVEEAWSVPGTRRPVEFNILDAKGNVRPVRATTRAVRVDGVVRSTTTFLVDLTHQREVEEQLRASQRMEAVGRLAGGVAHDFNNLLSVILSFTELAMGDLRREDPLHEDLGQVLAAARRAESLTRQLLAFSRRQFLQPAVFNPNELVEGLSRMLARLIGEDVELRTSLHADTWSIRADRGQLEQVLMNLVVNARDAMERGGTVTIGTCNTALDAHAAAILEVPPGDYVELEVRDTGSGMDRATQERMFEPFFTTKGPGKGTGLGLAMVYGIVKQSGGGIRVRSAPGEGTVFTVFLPRSKLNTGEFPAAVSRVARAARGETVLVVEDEESLRNVARRVLAGAGYHVLVAANGGEALLLCERDGARVDLILTDVVMPGMSGPELVDRLKGLCPKAHVLFTSGYPQDHLGPQPAMKGPLLRKPYDAAKLTARVDEILGQQPAAAST